MAAKKRETLSWEPRHRGDIYCSPACGHGCTRRKYEQACAAAKKLAKQLGPGWSSRVWENLGWHYEVVNGTLSVMPPRADGRFSAQFARGSLFSATTAHSALARLRTHLVMERKRITTAIDALT